MEDVIGSGDGVAPVRLLATLDSPYEDVVDQFFLNKQSHLANFTSYDSDNLSFAWGGLYDYADLAGMHDAILDQFYDDLLTTTSAFTVVLITLYSLAFVVGLLGNCTVIIVVLSRKQMRTVTNTFLVNLAVADQLVVVVCFPFSLAPYVYRPWIYGDILCRITPFIQGTSVGVSVFTLLAISIDRFFAIYQPLKSRLLFSRRRVKWLLICVWIVSMLVSLPMLLVNSVKIEGVKDFAEIATCREVWAAAGSKQAYNVFVFLVLYVIPVLFMSIAYVRIGKTLWSTDSAIERRSCRGDTRNKNGSFTNKVTQERRKIVRMLIMVAVMFAVSWLPYHVVTLYLDFNPNGLKIGMLAMYVYPMVQWFSLFNSAINPVCYCLLSKRFQSAFVCCCKRFCCLGNTTQPSSGRLRRGGQLNRKSWSSVFRGSRSRCDTIRNKSERGSVVIKLNGVRCHKNGVVTHKTNYSVHPNAALNKPAINQDFKRQHSAASACSSTATRYSDNIDMSNDSINICIENLNSSSPLFGSNRARAQSQILVHYPIKSIRHAKSLASAFVFPTLESTSLSEFDHSFSIAPDTDSMSINDDIDLNSDPCDQIAMAPCIRSSTRKLSDAILHTASDWASGFSAKKSTSCTINLCDQKDLLLCTEQEDEHSEDSEKETVL